MRGKRTRVMWTLLCLGLMSTSALVSQVRPGETLRRRLPGRKDVRVPESFVFEKGSGKLVWEREHRDEEGLWTVEKITQTVTFPSADSIVRLYYDFWILAGYNPTTDKGYLQRLLLVRGANPSIIKLEEKVYEGIQPWSLSWSKPDGVLYVWDCKGTRILAGDMASHTSSLPSKAQLLANPGLGTSSVPAIGDPGHYPGLAGDRETVGIELANTSRHHFFGTMNYPRYKIRWDRGSKKWSFHPYSMYKKDALAEIPFAIQNGWTLKANGGFLRFRGRGGEYRIRDAETLQVVHGFTLPPADPKWWEADESQADVWTDVSLPNGVLTPGQVYEVYHVASGTETDKVMRIFPMVRYGSPQSANIGGIAYSLQSASTMGWEHKAGTSSIVAESDLRSDATSATGLDMASFLYIGVRRPDGTDPVEVAGNMAILTEVLAVLGPHYFKKTQRWGDGELTFSYAMPGDPALVGTVFLYQLAVVAGSEILVTDIVGAPVLPSATSAQKSAGSGGKKAAGSSLVKKALEKVKSSVASNVASLSVRSTLDALLKKKLLQEKRK